MRKNRVALIALCGAFLSVAAGDAQVKQSREEFLKGKVTMATSACHQEIVATAKDPDSVKFYPEEETFTLGRALTRNVIYIRIPIMARNTYGAVLRHVITCMVNCTEKNGCHFEGFRDDS